MTLPMPYNAKLTGYLPAICPSSGREWIKNYSIDNATGTINISVYADPVMGLVSMSEPYYTSTTTTSTSSTVSTANADTTAFTSTIASTSLPTTTMRPPTIKSEGTDYAYSLAAVGIGLIAAHLSLVGTAGEKTSLYQLLCRNPFPHQYSERYTYAAKPSMRFMYVQ